MKYELMPQFTNVKSFYRKAIVIIEGKEKTLQSYDTLVCKIDKDNNIVKLWDSYSATTQKHINEFLQQNGLASMTKKEWLAL